MEGPSVVSMELSSLGVKKDTDMRRSYIELAIFQKIENKNITLMVLLTRSVKILINVIKSIVPDVTAEELSAIRKEVNKMIK